MNLNCLENSKNKKSISLILNHLKIQIILKQTLKKTHNSNHRSQSIFLFKNSRICSFQPLQINNKLNNHRLNKINSDNLIVFSFKILLKLNYNNKIINKTTIIIMQIKCLMNYHKFLVNHNNQAKY